VHRVAQRDRQNEMVTQLWSCVHAVSGVSSGLPATLGCLCICTQEQSSGYAVCVHAVHLVCPRAKQLQRHTRCTQAGGAQRGRRSAAGGSDDGGAAFMLFQVCCQDYHIPFDMGCLDDALQQIIKTANKVCCVWPCRGQKKSIWESSLLCACKPRSSL
jgi:hypothetical protein